MAIGDKYQNNKQQRRDPEVYSYYSMSNIEGVDPSMLSIGFWNGMMKLSISPMLQNPTTEHRWDKENAIVVYITHTKARTLSWIIQQVLDPEKKDIHSGGINTGSDGLVCFSDGKELGIDNPCVIIRKIDQNDGHVVSSYVYEFKFNYHYAIVNFNPGDATHDKIYFDNIEVEQFCDILKGYYEAMNNTIAYSVVNQCKYDFSRINTKLDGIVEHLGITYDGKANYSKKTSGNSFFNKGGGTSNSTSSAGSRSATIDDIDNDLND